MNPYRHRALLVLIGVSATALALIAFSSAWCAIVSTCGLEGEACDASFWEVFGLGGGSIALLLLIRPLRRRFRSHTRTTTPRTSLSPPPTSPVTSDALACGCDPAAPICEQSGEQKSGGWKDLYAQMTPEEQEQFRRMMQQICTKNTEAEMNELPLDRRG